MQINPIKRGGLFLIAFLCCGTILAQEYINGKLMDEKNGDPIPFATIRIKSKAVGVISNEDGSFRIPVHFKKIGDTLDISSLGYKSKEVLLSRLQLNKANVVFLNQEIETLNEVVVVSKKSKQEGELTANKIVRKALEGIYENFPHKPFSYIGYYRDYQILEQQYLNLNEGVMSIYDNGFGYNDYKTTKGQLYAFRENTEFPRDAEAEQPYDSDRKKVQSASLSGYGGNEFSILRAHDAIRNYNVKSYSYVQNFMLNFENNHRFIREADTSFDGESLYALRILTSKNGYRAEGKIYIFKKNFAIHRMEYGIFAVIERTPSRLAKEKSIFDIVVEYREENDQMYLNYISFNNAFSFLRESSFKVEGYFVDYQKQCFVVKFNGQPALPLGIRSSKYLVSFKGKKISWDRIKINENEVYLYPKLKSNMTFAETFTSGKGNEGSYQFKVKPIFDTDGNRLHKKDLIEANQFREFFVQELRLDDELSENANSFDETAFFNKDKPLSTAPVSNQKIASYWMNTPLKKTRK